MKKLSVIIFMILISPLIFGQDGFGDIFGSDVVNESQEIISSNGDIGFDYLTYFDDSWESEKVFLPFINLNLQFSKDSFPFEAKIELNIAGNDLNSTLKVGDVVRELSLRSFFSFGYLDLGLFKTEWGMGDGIHVIDPLNPLDQSNGISSDINEMKRPEIMAKMNFYIGEKGLFEMVYKPYYHSVETANPGDRWNIVSPFYTVQDNNDTETPAFSQAAARLTTTLGIFDLGGMYYYGYMTEPGFELIFTPGPVLDTVYTKAQLFGLEAGWSLGPFTFRTEGGYWLSEDREGTVAHLYNDRAVWLAGFDIMIPGTFLFVSVQEFGSYVVNFDSTNPLDMDLGMSYKDNAFTNTVVATVEGLFYQDKMKLRLAGLYLFEANGYMILPTYTWNIEDDLEFSLSGQFFGGADEGPNPYYAWRNNDNISLELKYIF